MAACRRAIERKAVARQADGRLRGSPSAAACRSARARYSKAAGSPGMAADSGPADGSARDRLAGGIEIHVARGGAGRLLARIEHGLVAVGLPVQQVEPAARRDPELVGSTTASAADTATAASKALPPCGEHLPGPPHWRADRRSRWPPLCACRRGSGRLLAPPAPPHRHARAAARERAPKAGRQAPRIAGGRVSSKLAVPLQLDLDERDGRTRRRCRRAPRFRAPASRR